MSFELERVNPSFQEVSPTPELQHQIQSDTSGELADSELESVAGGCGPGDKDDGIGESLGAGVDRTITKGINKVKKVWAPGSKSRPNRDPVDPVGCAVRTLPLSIVLASSFCVQD
ncbi:MAG: hypothetical protein HC941_06025 [Microcoleus sp. SU_5_3]|nr:hypothetical protein [Microcoleus sp. SU_5_3]